VIHALLALCGSISVLTTIGIIGVLIVETVGSSASAALALPHGHAVDALFFEKHYGIMVLASALLTTVIALGVALPSGSSPPST
jgi:phosphate transport system permease protein